MKKYVCKVCGYIYDPAAGDPVPHRKRKDRRDSQRNGTLEKLSKKVLECEGRAYGRPELDPAGQAVSDIIQFMCKHPSR